MIKYKLPLECISLFLIAPTIIHLLPFKRGVFIFIWMGAVFCYLLLKKDVSFERKHLWHWEAVNWKNLQPIIARFLIGAIIMTVGVFYVEPERLFNFPLERPQMWLVVMFAYPLLSVYPQEVIFRAFFIHRYREIFTSRSLMFGVNALAFGYAHILFNHWFTMALSAVGGWIFAYTYYKQRSLALVCIEHALYGCWIFTVGLGYYFYAGATR